jgi:hypothetical protein
MDKLDKWEALRFTIKELYDNNKDKPDVENVTMFLLNFMRALDEKEQKKGCQ